MDDFKREIWMRVREGLVAGKSDWICNALEKELWKLQIAIYLESAENSLAILQEFFPEFFALNDGKMWLSNGEYQFHQEDSISPSWFESYWLEPRLRLIDHILSST